MIVTDNSAVIENLLKENESLRKRIAALEEAYRALARPSKLIPNVSQDNVKILKVTG